MNTTETIFKDDDFVVTHKNGKVFSGGFHINSILMNQGLSPIVTLNSKNGVDKSECVSDFFDSLVVPNWLVSYSHLNSLTRDIEGEEMSGDLYEKLLDIVTVNEKKQTKKKRKFLSRSKSIKNI